MLTENERKVCKQVLEVVNDADLRRLVQSITHGSVVVESRQEAFEAILHYSTSVDELLNRQKIKKDYLRSYLAQVADDKVLPGIFSLDKEELIRLTKEKLKQTTQKPALIQRLPEPQSQDIAVAFISWFYNMLNSSISGKVDSNWGPSHFWDDAKLVLQVEQPDTMIKDEIQNASDVSQRLLAFVWTYQTMFNPNLTSNGFHSELNCHGLLAVKSAGTLHKNSNVVGLYEQVFGLIKDPIADGNWKIKNTELRAKLKCSDQKSIHFS